MYTPNNRLIMNIMNRIKPLLPLLGAVVAVISISSCCSKPEPKTIGIQLYTVMNSMKSDARGTLEALSSYGYNSYELVQWGGDPNVFGLPASEFKSICDSLGASIVSTHSSLTEDPENEETVMNRWRELFGIQKACGGKYFVIPSYHVDYSVEDVQRECDYFNRVGRVAAEYGLKLGYHNHAHEFQTLKDSDKVMWEYLVEHTDPQYVCFELDVFWCRRGGKDPVEYLKKYPERIALLHIKDEFVIGQSGELDIEAIFKQFYANGMSDWFVEIEAAGDYLRNADGTPYTRPQIDSAMLQAAKLSAEYLRNADFVR